MGWEIKVQNYRAGQPDGRKAGRHRDNYSFHLQPLRLTDDRCLSHLPALAFARAEIYIIDSYCDKKWGMKRWPEKSARNASTPFMRPGAQHYGFLCLMILDIMDRFTLFPLTTTITMNMVKPRTNSARNMTPGKMMSESSFTLQPPLHAACAAYAISASSPHPMRTSSMASHRLVPRP